MPDGVRTTPATLEGLMMRLVAGDTLAFEPLFAALWRPALRYAQHLVGDAAAAEDVTQRALIRLFEEAPGYRRGSAVLPWALSLTYWEARSERRRRTRSKVAAGDVHGAVDERPNALNQLMDEEARSELMRLTASMSPEDRAILGLEDTTLAAHISPSAVRKRRQRLLDRLRQALSELAFARSDDHDH